jgi:hypothetical protein
MSFAWEDLLPLSEALTSLDGDINREACLRAAISRASYAVFGMARRGARPLRLATRQSAAEHGEVAAFYATRYGKAGEEIAIALGRLRKRRNAADYDDEFADVEGVCLKSIESARDVLQLLATL